MAWGTARAPFDVVINRLGVRMLLCAPDAKTALETGKVLYENAQTVAMLGREQANLYTLYFSSTLHTALAPGMAIALYGDQPGLSSVWYVIVKTLETTPGVARSFLKVGQMATALQLPLLVLWKHMAGTPEEGERGGFDEALDPANTGELRSAWLPAAYTNDSDPFYEGATQMVRLPAGTVTLQMPMGAGIGLQDVLILPDGRALEVQQANPISGQGRDFVLQVIGLTLPSDPYALVPPL
jgi:hypothetical protein